jgi:hypothetical protein
MHRAVNAIIEEEVFYAGHIYPLLGNGCVFKGPSRDYISGTEPKKEEGNEKWAGPRQSRKKGSAEHCLLVIEIDRDSERL